MRNAFKSLLLAFITMFAGVVAYAQVTTSALSGRVVDQNGEPVIGAAVMALHEPSGTSYGAVTNVDGRYTIQGMRTGGPYKVDFVCLGYQDARFTDVTLQLGETYRLDSALSEASEMLEGTIVIAAPTSKFAQQERIGAATNISNQDLLAVPTASRSISDLTKLSPYGGNGMDIAGGDGRSVNFTIDGANFNNNFGLSSTLPGGGMPVSMDAIEEIQIVVSPFDVRQTNFIGGGVNAITKSGTNTVKVTAYAYHQNPALSGKKIADQDISSARDMRTVFGGTVGFPIVKNKLFFFGSAEYYGNPSTVSSWHPYDGTDADILANGDKNSSTSRTTVADMQRVSDHLSSVYGYDTGGWSNYKKNVSNLKLLGRIDWNITNNHHLALRYNYTSNKSWVGTNGSSADFNSTVDGGSDPLKGYRLNGTFRLSELSMAFVNSLYSMENNVHSVSLDLNSRFGDNVNNQFLVTYSNIQDVRGSDSSKFPFIDIMNGYTGSMAEGNLKQTLEPYMAAGYELFTWNNGVHNHAVNAKDDVTITLGAHKLIAGVSYEYMFADNAYMREGTGYYRFRSVDDLINGAAPETVALTYGYGGEENPSARIQYHNIGLYAQDEWAVSERLKLTAGLRLDSILYDENDLMTNSAIMALNFGGRMLDTGKWPYTTVQVSPRVGFNWDVLGNKSLTIRGGTGLFAGRLPLVYMTNMPSNAAMFQHLSVLTTQYNSDGTIAQRNAGLDQFAASANGGRFPTTTEEILAKFNQIDPQKNPIEITPEDGALQSTVNGVDRNFKMPQVWKSSLGIDYKLPVDFPFTLTAEATFNKTVNGTQVVNWNIRPNTDWSQWTGSDNRHIYPSDANYTGYPCYILTNTNKGYGFIGVFALSMKPVSGLTINASYTYNVQKELTGMPGNNAESVYTGLYTVEGPNFATLHGSQYVMPHRVMANINYRIPYSWGATSISLFYNGYVSPGLSYSFTNDVNGDGIAADLIYIPKDRDDILFVDEQNADNFFAFMEQDKYLSSHKGQYAGAYAVHSPMTHHFDLKLTQDFKIKIGRSTNILQINADLMNASNLLNNKWGAYRTLDKSANLGKILTYDHLNENGQPVFSTPLKAGAKTWDYFIDNGSAWYLQLGVKYMFNL